MNFRCASEKDIPRLKEIYSLFGDSKEDIDRFFKFMFCPENFLAAEENGTIASFLALFPCTLLLEGREYKISYLYGFCTAEEFRGNHIGSDLLDYAAVYASLRGDRGIALLPGEKWLLSYYEKRGYRKAFTAEKNDRNYISYPEEYLKFVSEDGEHESAIDGEFEVPGVFLNLTDVPEFNAYMAYPMN